MNENTEYYIKESLDSEPIKVTLAEFNAKSLERMLLYDREMTKVEDGKVTLLCYNPIFINETQG